MFNVKNRWAFITGASRGIGKLSAVFMAKQGCNLILHARKIENLSDVETEAKAYGVEVKKVACELSDLDAVDKMLKEIDAFNVDVDIVLNNAGLQIAYRTEYYETPVSDYMESYKINTVAPAMICYHFLPKMEAKGLGRIVNTTSGIALEPEQAGYSASKAALDKITIDLGSKLEGSDVLISLADPGWCRTDLGGPQAPNAPESTIPGIVIGAFVDDGKSGRLFGAQDYNGLTLEEAYEKAQKTDSPYNK